MPFDEETIFHSQEIFVSSAIPPYNIKVCKSTLCFVCVICSYPTVGFVLLADGWRVRCVTFTCSHKGEKNSDKSEKRNQAMVALCMQIDFLLFTRL